jgi:hypothetical protein
MSTASIFLAVERLRLLERPGQKLHLIRSKAYALAWALSAAHGRLAPMRGTSAGEVCASAAAPNTAAAQSF